MFSRKNHYEATPPTNASLDDLSRKLAVDLRKHVRKLDYFEVYSKGWLGLCDSLLHVSNIALMEHRVPRDDDSATLWEGDELTVRFLLEEGKLNLCLRLMHEYKTKQAQATANGPAQYAEFLAKTAQEGALADGEQLKARLLVFEQSLGVLLRCALEHIEAVQTTDLPELMAHANEVLVAARAAQPGTLHFDRTQEAVILRYLASVMLRIEVLGEDRVLPLLQQHNLVPLAIEHLHTYHAELKAEGQTGGALFLALVFDAEDFSTHKAAFLPPEAKALLKDFKPLFLSSITTDMEQRRKLRPLLDEVTKAGG